MERGGRRGWRREKKNAQITKHLRFSNAGDDDDDDDDATGCTHVLYNKHVLHYMYYRAVHMYAPRWDANLPVSQSVSQSVNFVPQLFFPFL